MTIYTYKIGEEVSFIHESGKGTVAAFLPEGKVMVMTEDGFEMPYLASQLVPRFDLKQREPEPEVELAPEVPEVPVEIEEMSGMRLGARVHVLDQEDSGMILKFYPNGSADVEFEDLFVKRFPINELTVYTDARKMAILQSMDEMNLSDIGETSTYRNPQQALQNRKDSGVWEVDLHIQELVDNSHGMMKHEIVQLQLDTFSKKLDEAIERDMKKVIFIHGRGEGRLRTAIREILTRYSNCECLDADYQRYGVGATEVRIKYKIVEEE